MTGLAKLLTTSALCAGLAACAQPNVPLSPMNNPSVYSVHQPVVERTDYVLDLAAAGDGLSAAELARLDQWFRSIELRYGDKISVDEPVGYLADRARSDVARVAGRYGLLLSDEVPITEGAVQPGTVRVIASRASASVPGCPNWDSETQQLPHVGTMPNYGCGVNSNIAAMVADPNDLVRGDSGNVSRSAGTASRAIRVYRESRPTGTQPLPQQSTRSGSQ